jgi:hypothetical protein
MAVISLKEFRGAVPKLPPHQLPDGYSQYALNLQTGHGEFRPIKGLLTVSTMSNIVRGLYTEDGHNFYTWDYDVFAVRSPIIDDVNGRFYYSKEPVNGLPGKLCVYTLTAPPAFASYGGVKPTGGPPAQELLLGVPKLESTPTASAVNSYWLPALTDRAQGMNLALYMWYESGGKQYQRQRLLNGTQGAHVTGTWELGPLHDTVSQWTIFPFALDLITPLTNQQGTGGHDPVAGNLLDVYCSSFIYEQGIYETGNESPNRIGTQQVVQAVNGMVRITSATSLGILNNLGEISPGQEFQDVVSFIDKNGITRSLTETVTTYTEDTSTPADATLCVEAVLSDAATGQTLFDLYSIGSVLSSKSTGVIADLPPLTVNKNGDGEDGYEVKIAWGVWETRAYVVTLVNPWGEESAPSEAVTVTLRYNEQARITFTHQNADLYKEQSAFRVYRTNSSSNNTTTYQFVGEQTLLVGFNHDTVPHLFVAEYVYDDTLASSKLGEVLPSTGWDVPPSDLHGLVALPNGVLAAFKGNQLYFSEPYIPYAWPVDYIQSFPFDIIGMCPHGNGLLVTTTANPFMVTGVHPENMTQQKLALAQAGVSSRGIADLGTAVAYLSNDGIVFVTGGQGTLEYSQQLFTRDDWRRLFNNDFRDIRNMRLACYDGMLIGTSALDQGFILRLDAEGQGQFCMYEFAITATFYIPWLDKLLMATGNALKAFGESPITELAEWWSKDYVLPRPINFGVIQLVLQASPNTPDFDVTSFGVYADGHSVATISLATDARGGPIPITNTAEPISLSSGSHPQQVTLTYRLPSGFVARRWSVFISGRAIVKEVHLASTPAELQNV